MEQIRCKDLSVGYNGAPVAARLDFSVSEGDYFCIVGENGTGKSTLMKTLLGLIPPLSGEVRLSPWIKPCDIGYLSQQTLVQKDFPASVEEIVLSGALSNLKIRPFYSKADRASARLSMEQMDILPLAKRCFRELSGGQQQRVLLARALCGQRRILFLDEPVSGLDPTVTAELYQLMRQLNTKLGITIVMISHDINAVLSDATHILNLGACPFIGTREEYINFLQEGRNDG